MSWLLDFYLGSFAWDFDWAVPFDMDLLLDLVAPPMAAK